MTTAITASDGQPAQTTNPEVWRGRVVRGSAILLLSTGLVAATNLLYTLLLAHMLGVSGFGHASALYTLLMLVTAVTWSFQIVTSKFTARTSDVVVQAQIYGSLLQRAWIVGLGTAALIAAGSSYLQHYLNLPQQHDLWLLAIAAGVYVPLGVRRGRMQGCYRFTSLAINVVVEVAVKFGGAILFLHYGMGVTGVMWAIMLSIVAAYAAGPPGKECRIRVGRIKIAPMGEGVQAVSYFVGQVILSNLDILLVKHFFSPSQAGIYAAVALVGRVVFMLSWSVVSSMFPVSASNSHAPGNRSVLYTALLLVSGVTFLFVSSVAMAPQALWSILLGKQFLFGSPGSFSGLLTDYAAMTGVYSVAVVIMMYEISRRIGSAAWVQMGASALVAGGIWIYHNSLAQVIWVQMWVMAGLLLAVSVPLFRERETANSSEATWHPLRRLRRVPEEEIIAEFLRSEFFHPEFDTYRDDFRHLVEHGDRNDPHENFIRRALLFKRRGGLWRELPEDTEWWEVELTPEDLVRLRSFPRNEWRRFAEAGFQLTEMVPRIAAELARRGEHTRFLKKLGAIGNDLHQREVPDAVLLIGIDEYQSLTIIEGNHRMAAAMLTTPETAHRRYRFYCGLSPQMNLCCWHKTDLRSLTRYARHTIRYMFHDADFFVARILREKLAQIETS